MLSMMATMMLGGGAGAFIDHRVLLCIPLANLGPGVGHWVSGNISTLAYAAAISVNVGAALACTWLYAWWMSRDDFVSGITPLSRWTE
jgi:hypothetical protein